MHAFRTTRVEAITCAAVALLLWRTPAVLANGGPVYEVNLGTSTVGTIVPLRSRNVTLVRERVRLDMFPQYTWGRVVYVLRNDGPATTVTFGFPTVLVRTALRQHVGDYLHYAIRLDGKPIPQESRTGQALRAADIRQTLLKAWRSHAMVLGESRISVESLPRLTSYSYRVSSIRFAARLTHRVEIEFLVPNIYLQTYVKTGPMRVMAMMTYLTQPAARWAGRIQSARFELHVHGIPATSPGTSPQIEVSPTPTRATQGTYEWHYTNWKPSAPIRAVLRFATKQHTMELVESAAKAIGTLVAPPVPAGMIKRDWTVDAMERRGRIDRKYRLPQTSRWLLADQVLADSGNSSTPRDFVFSFARRMCVIGIMAVQRAGIRVSQPSGIELQADGGGRHSIPLDRVDSLFDWRGLQWAKLRSPVNALQLRVRFLNTSTPGRATRQLRILRFGLLHDPRACPRRVRTER